MWNVDAGCHGPGSRNAKYGFLDQEDELVKSMLSFDDYSDEESYSEQTLLASEASVGRPESPNKQFCLEQGLASALTDSSSLMSDSSFFEYGQQLVQAASASFQDTSISVSDLSAVTRPQQVSGHPDHSEEESRCKKQKVQWTKELHTKFVQIVESLGAKCTPSKILEVLGPAASGITPQEIATHLQVYRQNRSQCAAPVQAPHAPSLPVISVQPPNNLPMTGLPASFPAGLPFNATWPFAGMGPLPPIPGQMPAGPSMLSGCMLPGAVPAPANLGGLLGTCPPMPGAAAAHPHPVPGSVHRLACHPMPGVAACPPMPGTTPAAPACPPVPVPGAPMSNNIPLMPYALPMQMANGQCWVQPAFHMPTGQQPQLPAPQPGQQSWMRPMPMIPTPSSATASHTGLHGPCPGTIHQAIAEILERPSQAIPPIGLKLDTATLAKQWNSGQVKAVRS